MMKGKAVTGKYLSPSLESSHPPLGWISVPGVLLRVSDGKMS